jgi:hypothetical protein
LRRVSFGTLAMKSFTLTLVALVLMSVIGCSPIFQQNARVTPSCHPR